MNTAIISVVLTNLVLSKTMQEIFNIDLGFDVFWIWLNFTGVILAFVMAHIVSAFTKNVSVKHVEGMHIKLKKSDFMIKEVYILSAFFFAILVFSYFIPTLFS